jgi:hypothetical protein
MTAGKLNLVSHNSNIQVDVINIGYDQDIPKFSFFDTVYRRHTNFSIDNRQLQLNGTANFGETFDLIFQQNGDLAGDIYLEITLPSATSCFSSLPNSYANWTNSIGFALIESVKLYVGGSIVDEQDGTWFDIQNELTDPTRKLWPMIGKVDDTTKLKFFQNQSTKYSVPLMFSFCKHPGLALPVFMTGIGANEFKIEIKFRNISSLLLHDGGSTPSGSVTSVTAHATYYTLETYEKERIKKYRNITRSGKRKLDNRGDLVHLIETVQHFTHTDSSFTLNDIKGSVKELFWVLQPNERLSSNSPIINDNLSLSTLTGNDYFNYSNTSLTNNSRDTFTNLKVKVGTFDYETKNASHFRHYLPYKHHSNVPNSYVYCLPLCLNPEDYQPSGALNLLNTKTDIQFNFDSIPSGFSVKIYSKSYRFLLMNTNKARVADVTSKTQSDILQDSFKKTDYEWQDSTDIQPDIVSSRDQAEKTAQETKRMAIASGTAANFELLVGNFNQQILAQNNRILQLQEFINQSQQTIKILNTSLTGIAEDVRRMSQSKGGSSYTTVTAYTSAAGRAMPIAKQNTNRRR